MGKKGKAKTRTNEEAQALLKKKQLKLEKKQLRRKNIREAIERRHSSLLPVDWSSLKLPPINKDVYEEYVKTSNISPDRVERYRKERSIYVKGVAPNPIASFNEVCFPNFLMEKILRNYKEPTPVQSQIWPTAMRGHNVVCLASGDKGVTLAYLLPAILHIRAQPPPTKREGSIVLILSPNNQNVEEIEATVQAYTSGASIHSMCLVTGVNKDKQIADVAIGHHIIIGTPTRVSSFLIDGHVNFKRCTFVIVNDPDRMTGADREVKMILGQTRPDRQILVVCTTMPGYIKEFVGDYIEISAPTTEQSGTIELKQHVDVGLENEKGPKLKELLLKIHAGQPPFRRGKIMIFVATKRRVDKVRKFVISFLEHCSAIHSDKHKGDRALMLKDFATGKSKILITTDTSDRDIKVDKIMYVINFDHPLEPNNYLRRLRRIDPGMPGHSFTFFTRKDAMFAQRLIDDLRKSQQFVGKGLLNMARVGSDPTKNKMPVYYPQMKSGIMVPKNKVPQAFGKPLADAGDDVPESETESDAEDVGPYESRKNDSDFECEGGGSGYGSSSSGFGNKRDDRGRGLRDGGSGLHAGGGAGFGDDSGGFRKNSGFNEFRSEGGARGFSGGGERDIRIGSVSGFSSPNVGLNAGGGAGFGNMGNDTEFSSRVGGSGFSIDGDRDRGSPGEGFGNMYKVTGFGGNVNARLHNTACDSIGNDRFFGSKNGGNLRKFDSLDNENRFGNIGGRGTGYHNRDGDSVFSRNKFAAERAHGSRKDNEFNRRNDEYFSRNFGDCSRSGEVGDARFQRDGNDNVGRYGTNSNPGGNNCYSQGNGGFTGSSRFAERVGDRVRGCDNSDGFGNRDHNFRDARRDGGFRNEDDHHLDRRAINNRIDNDFNRRGNFNSTENTLFKRREVRHFDNSSGVGDYSGGYKSNRNRSYNPHNGGGHGMSSGYGR